MDYYDFVAKPKLTVEYLEQALRIFPELTEDPATAHEFQDQLQTMYINRVLKEKSTLSPDVVKMGKLIQRIHRIKYDKWYA